MVSMRTLQKIAIYGGIVSLGGAGYMSWKMYSNFQNQDFVTESLKILSEYPPATRLLGKPIRTKRLNLGDLSMNYNDGLNAKVTIPLVGAIESGTLYAWSSRKSGKDKWQVQKCDIETGGRLWTFYLNPSAEDKYTPTDTSTATPNTACTEQSPKQREPSNSELKYLS